ncbi:alpha/beta hydrolase [Streptomyces sp. AV19]|uniref:alpha/beta fold hydrolase n=1 Tax=Streptomyces sp. AV19 TaxID=2793068 RepID=UPI0018FE44A4|nr:alpha/beta hydrolase [Streptomyces sp. AV19]MBH1932963.1 alpha/beta hydrolase [Streptomyces sp. AV19]MDG4533866.1 alpha/beta hydrolase [Streptomyces sp. AV19]
MTVLEVGSTRLNVERLGDPARPAVVLVHGLVLDTLATYYCSVAGGLAAAGHSVVMYDQRGHGRSGRPYTGYRLQEFTADLLALLGTLGMDRPFFLVGDCFGGAVAMDFAVRYPHRLIGVVLIEAVLPTVAWAQGLSELLARHAEAVRDARAAGRIEREHGRDVARAARRSRPLLLGTTLVEDIAASRTREEGDWSSLDVPVLALYGGDFALARTAPALERALPRCRTVILPGHGHRVLVDARERVGALLAGWMREGHRRQ